MSMSSIRESSNLVSVAALSLLALGLAACGGAAGGQGPAGAGQGLVLVSFNVADQDTVSLNQELVFDFSEPVAPGSVNNASIQIRRGDAFGLTVQGEFVTTGSRVTFRPVLAGLCDQSDAGLQPDVQYRVTVVGSPEAFALKNTKQQPLMSTSNFEFHTRPDSDPNLYIDQEPGEPPHVHFFEPGDGLSLAPGAPSPAAISVAQGNQIVVRMSENLTPCSVNESTVLFSMYQKGDPLVFTMAPNGNDTGFASATDADPGNDYSWGPGNVAVSPPQRIPAKIELTQDFEHTVITVTPTFGEYPDNALLVLELTFGIRDYSGQALSAERFAFTTENLPARPGALTLEFNGDVDLDTGASTADVNTVRAASKAQGFLLFAGDGDNGSVLTTPAAPLPCVGQSNTGSKTAFAPLANVLLNTGSVVNTCNNVTDGSTAVVYEFSTLRIASGVAVRVVGVNPAIILVQGDVLIESGGSLLGRGDGQAGSPQGRGTSPTWTSGTTAPAPGGTGVAGGGDGGSGLSSSGPPARYGEAGRQGYFYSGTTLSPTVGTTTGPGVGRGNSSCLWSTQSNPNNRNTPGGGGGGHAAAGTDGSNLGSGSSPTVLDLTPDGVGGGTYGDTAGAMYLPEAGSGGGAGGEIRAFTSTIGQGPGAGGGAGGGFIDLTAGGSISIFGTVDVAGAAGGNGCSQTYYSWSPGTGGGGGGSGGGLRLLTPNDIVLSSTSVVTAAGGNGGAGGSSQGGGPPVNPGGAGGAGRLVFEDSDGVIAGYGGAAVSPAEPQPGFRRGIFNAARFTGGGLEPQAVTLPVFAGPLSATFTAPVQADFVVGLPPGSSRPTPGTCILVEAQGFPILADGSADLGSGTGWWTVGHFRDSGNPAQPAWFPDVNPPPADVLPPSGNLGPGIVNLNGSAYVQLRITFYLPLGIGPLDPGPFIDRMIIRFTFDQ